jgi:hypothetical protein
VYGHGGALPAPSALEFEPSIAEAEYELSMQGLISEQSWAAAVNYSNGQTIAACVPHPHTAVGELTGTAADASLQPVMSSGSSCLSCT